MSEKNLEISDSLEKFEKEGERKKLKFTPPVLHKYGEVVKICQAGVTQGQGDFYTQTS